MKRRCKYLKSDYEGARQDCVDKVADECLCPKYRGKWIITPGCWKVEQ